MFIDGTPANWFCALRMRRGQQMLCLQAWVAVYLGVTPCSTGSVLSLAVGVHLLYFHDAHDNSNVFHLQ